MRKETPLTALYVETPQNAGLRFHIIACLLLIRPI
jgi:hypothetical protein